MIYSFKILINTMLLVLYVFSEYNERVKQFLKNCIFYDEKTDFIIIINNPNANLTIPANLKNVKVIIRNNIGYDFGGWSHALLKDKLYEKYDNFIFVNSSVIGPFLPSFFKGKWTDIYINGLTQNVKLFGSTINTSTLDKSPNYFNSHVQSYIFSMNKETLLYLIQCGIFSIPTKNVPFNTVIIEKEILMSRKIIEKGWNIGSLLSQYLNIDFTTKTPNIQLKGDLMYNKFRNELWNEYELVFIKGNRDITLKSPNINNNVFNYSQIPISPKITNNILTKIKLKAIQRAKSRGRVVPKFNTEYSFTY